MFQTLVNVDSRIEQIWKPILGENYTTESSKEYAQLLLEHFFIHWNKLKSTGQFFLMKEVYGRSFANVFEGNAILFDINEALRILFQEHTCCHVYEDTIEFLEQVTKEYNVCIVSDADDGMIPSFYKTYGIHLFTSERYQSYKNDERNNMFKALQEFYAVDPEQIIHIGDSVSDIHGAHREGIITCWLNRNNKSWEHEEKPDYIIKSLSEIKDIL